jgi:hypothetical protein
MKASAKIALLVLIGPMLTSLWGGCPQIGSKDSTESPLRIDAVTPDSGPTTGGTRVTIRGGPFQDNVGVLFGSFAGVDPIIVNSRMITVLTPAQDAGVVNVSVLTDLGFVNVLGAFTYQAVPAPHADHIFPNSGPVSGGTEVTITGENFTENTRVLFDQSPATNIRLVTAQILSVTTPPHAVGPVDVTLMNGNEQQVLDDGFNYEAEAPAIDSTEPASGPIEGGTQVTIRGSNLPANATIIIGAANVPATFVNSSVLTFITPSVAAPGLVPISILLENGVDQIVAGDFEYTSDAPYYDDGTDTDGDGLTDVQETTGWSVWIDAYGLQLGTDTFGNVLVQYAVTSDPSNADTDGDGLSDYDERLYKSDPRKADSDEDGLWDGEEVHRWHTSPSNVDTDADSRGDRNLQNAPNPGLFDGMELFDSAVLRLPPADPLRIVKARATSSTMADTDGDGVSDFDEAGSTVRNGVLADLPRLDYELVGDVDVRLNVEYAETVGETKEYGTTLTESRTETVASSYSSTFGWSLDMSLTAGYGSGSVYAGYEVTAGIHGEYSWTSSNESSKESSKESSRLQSDSKEFTETAADGAIRTAILLKNPGNTTFTLDGLSVLVSQSEKRKAMVDTSPQRSPKAIATMMPVFDTITLAPGETAGPFELAATGVTAQAIKELLANPDTLMLGTAAMNFHDQNGLDFDFVRQFTIARTANIVIDFGDGEVRNYNIATNVDRNPDGSYAGITLRRVLEEMLQLPYGDPIQGYTTAIAPTGRQVLQSLLGREYAERPAGGARNFWSVVTNNPHLANSDFNNLVLHAGDGIALFFERDDDNDGLSNTLEKAAGTDQDPLSPTDSDGDGLTDKFEVVDGWIAFEDPAHPDAPHPDGFEKRRVFSSPTSLDSDGDGLSDASEFAWRTDPLDPDSDGDGLLDGQDPFPNRRANTVFVRADAPAGGNGRTWGAAVQTIQSAVSLYYQGLNSPNPSDDVSQIWVARGTYKPNARLTPIVLVFNLGIYGGFSGPGTGFDGETKRGQRITNAFANGCIISGDLAGNDIGEIDLDTPGAYNENCPVIISCSGGTNSSAVLDGFMITGAYARTGEPGGALRCDNATGPTIQNCLFTRNANQGSGAGVVVMGGPGGNIPTFKNCILAQNAANSGAGAFISGSGRAVFEQCEFSQNEARRRLNQDDPGSNGGAVFMLNAGRVDFNRCAFTTNRAWNRGGGIYAAGNSPTYARVDSCRFYSNTTTTTGWLGDWRGTGGAISLDADASVSNSVFWNNRAVSKGGGISVISGVSGTGPLRRCAITNCTIASNRSYLGADGGGVFTAGPGSNITVENTILWANWYGVDPLPDEPDFQEQMQIYNWADSVVSVRDSCLNTGWPWRYRGNNNINDDPSLNNLELGDVRLGEDSPCVDRGNTFVDLDPLLPGLQQLPQFDLFGNSRIIDGNGDGIVAVDFGAFEAPRTH